MSPAPAKTQPKPRVYQKVEPSPDPRDRLILVLELLTMLFTTQDTARREDNQPTVPITIESKLINSPLSILSIQTRPNQRGPPEGERHDK